MLDFRLTDIHHCIRTASEPKRVAPVGAQPNYAVTHIQHARARRVNILCHHLRSGSKHHRVTHHQRGDVLAVVLTFWKNHRKGGVRAHVITLLQTDILGFAGLVATGGKCCNTQQD